MRAENSVEDHWNRIDSVKVMVLGFWVMGGPVGRR
ncbi:hypothetical protein CCACVL1_24045 [Corchorus capsularis]|uniref:Uncharacterized protein n=1 Tax=Corchorus capsularis TaxID=210143 RepID=A0A1R3GR16_COCAP|nr:hypothetical protein CCACVL1_24045 [Corchorus capsularis]